MANLTLNSLYSLPDAMRYYETLRGVDVCEAKERCFWDLVVLSAADDAQKTSFDKQIEFKVANGDVPLGIAYRVVADPPGCKIGSGGSTLLILDQLFAEYGDKLSTWRVLMIHAGGQSKRLTTASALGKLFMAMPLGNPPHQVFDMKLAMYLPFLSKMPPGVFLACSDTTETYALPSDGTAWSFGVEGFTALAHPSSLEIGVGHGVYVVDRDVLQSIEDEKEKLVSVFPCRCVLQKPSVELMREQEAVVSKVDENNVETEIVFSDSCFSFSFDIILKLLTIMKNDDLDLREEIHEEIDVFRDILTPLGTCPFRPDSLSELRAKLFDALTSTPLTVVYLSHSVFYHFGTTDEYVEHYCENGGFHRELKTERILGSVTGAARGDAIDGVVLQSVMADGSRTHRRSIVEYCSFASAVVIPENCVISNVQTVASTGVMQFPEGAIFHTIPLRYANGTTAFVTLAFGCKDDMKKEVATMDDLMNIHYFNQSLSLLQGQGCDALFSPNQSRFSLWNIQLFSVESSMSNSLKSTLLLVKQWLRGSVEHLNSLQKRISLQEALDLKDIDTMLTFRQQLKR